MKLFFILNYIFECFKFVFPLHWLQFISYFILFSTDYSLIPDCSLNHLARFCAPVCILAPNKTDAHVTVKNCAPLRRKSSWSSASCRLSWPARIGSHTLVPLNHPEVCVVLNPLDSDLIHPLNASKNSVLARLHTHTHSGPHTQMVSYLCVTRWQIKSHPFNPAQAVFVESLSQVTQFSGAFGSLFRIMQQMKAAGCGTLRRRCCIFYLSITRPIAASCWED